MKTKTILARIPALFCGLAMLAAAAPALPQAQGLPLAGHQAVYRVSLAEADQGAGIAGVDGRLIYRFANACDGWTVENQVALRISSDEGGLSDSLWAYTSWEAKDGRSFRFRMRDERDGEIVEELGGAARMPAGGGPGVARLTVPAEVDVDLPAGTLFPLNHLMKLIEAGRAGQRYVSAYVFDGADLDNPYRVGAAVGPAAAARQKSLSAPLGLAELPIWSVQMAFFPGTAGTGLPSFEVGVQYREDGIAAEIVQDFGDFTLKMVPERIDLLPDPGC